MHSQQKKMHQNPRANLVHLLLGFPSKNETLFKRLQELCADDGLWTNGIKLVTHVAGPWFVP